MGGSQGSRAPGKRGALGSRARPNQSQLWDAGCFYLAPRAGRHQQLVSIGVSEGAGGAQTPAGAPRGSPLPCPTLSHTHTPPPPPFDFLLLDFTS